MAQAGSINLLATSTGSPTDCEVDGQPAEVDTLPTTATSQLKHQSSQQLEDLSQVKSAPQPTDDDEVQFVFSAPRRRKRKRKLKRFEFSYSPSMPSQCSVPPIDPPLRRSSTTPWNPLRRRSLGVLKQLESCNIGARESKDDAVRTGSLPIASTTSAFASNAQGSRLSDPNYSSVPTLQSPSHSSSMPWWDESRPPAQTHPNSFIDWRPLHVDDSVSKKRKLDTAADDHRLIRQPSQISPRTTPVSTLPPADSHTRYSAMDTSDGLWTSAIPSTSGTQPSNPPMFNLLSEFDWNAFEKLGTAQYGPQPSHQAMSMDITNANGQMAGNFSHQSRLGQFEPRGMWQQNVAQISSPQIPRHLTFGSVQTSQPFQNANHQIRPQQIVSHGSATPMNLCMPTSQPLPALPQNYNGPSRVSPILSSHQRGLQSQRKQTMTSPSPTQIGSQPVQTDPSDILRRPSLYTIPAWPSISDGRAAQMPMTASRPRSRPSSSNSNSNTIRNRGFRSNISFNGLIKPSKSIQPEEFPSRDFENSPWTGATNASSNRQLGNNGAAKADTFQLPQARASRKYCPNLIVDIAEMCQELFPFAEVAERHNVPIKKVFDTFSAIIQLPLLRNADDRRRHGSLGKRRMREYREARKAMEKAQEAERKVQMKTMKTRVEEAGKKGKGQANAALLKAAILNNACQAGSSS